MTNAATLDPGLDPSATAAGPATLLTARRGWLLGAVLVIVLALAQVVAGPSLDRLLEAIGVATPARAEATVRSTLAAREAVVRLTEGTQAEIVVQGALAQRRNEEIAVSGLPLEQARAFLLPQEGAAEGAYGTALTCLTQAVYFEAGYEPAAGKRAVAQVVLNRMRHPAYPKSVCGVVYQGSERRTGCQFSFTCDGSLHRRPGAAAWSDAHAVARAALAGHVEGGVGTATHYHADYVLPRWAFHLAKIEKIGAHIFYRFPGGWGTAGAFSGRYGGSERIPAITAPALDSAPVASVAGLPADIIVLRPSASQLTGGPAGQNAAARVNVTKLWRTARLGHPPAGRPSQEAFDGGGASADHPVSDGPIPVSNSAASALAGE